MSDYLLGAIVAAIWAVIFYITYHEKLEAESKNKYWTAYFMGIVIFVSISLVIREVLFPLSK